MSRDLITFVRARLDEDEQTARSARDHFSWRAGEGESKVLPVVALASGSFCIADAWYPEYAAHIARHDPARVLREVEAKRRRLDSLAEAIAVGHDTYDLASELLPLEALPYADHPEYREEWRP
ncbi:DUF6221 family protein [Streptomyces sp. NBC_01476]|uniref:DUF6221 family protein n=1 Tax=Streptomyces sp. NBC_01476 TaxID=2903881 RepID=UPI002E31919E|nr:DUF6221 family protein [Streptomyces sp. NBC_01476]